MKNKINNIVILTIALCIAAFTTVCAEGSRDLVSKGGYRPYLEWDSSKSAGITRQTTLNVYAKEGETIYFGSSVKTSFDSKDIIVRSPNGTETVYDVLSSGKGFINTVTKESIGPDIGTSVTSKGYTPLSFVVTSTGIWQFKFHAPLEVGGTNPPLINVTDKFATDSTQNATVAAWDISVYNSGGEYVTGRTFTNYIAMNLGNNLNASAMNSIFYILTKDGYIYETQTNGLDPYGFIFFANNRGVIDNQTGNTLYHNAPCIVGSTVIDPAYNLKLQDPSAQDTPYNITHRIFFNQPANDLPSSIPTNAIEPANISNFNFIGNSDNNAIINNGGTFSYTASSTHTYELKILFNNIAYKDITISNPGIAGTNSISWDGKDASGNIVQEGGYTTSLFIKSGEYHFPLIDAENNPNGIKITLLNPPYSVSGYSSDILYYNSNSYTAGNGKSTVRNTKGEPNPVDTSLNGINSSIGALKFDQLWGNDTVVDMWTYFPGETKYTPFNVVKEISSPSTAIDLKDFKFAYIFGYVPYYDENNKLILNIAPEDNVTREQVCAMIVRTLEQQTNLLDGFNHPSDIPQFTNLDSDFWSYHAIAYIASLGTFDGKTNLQTSQSVTRGEVAKLVAFGLKLSEKADISHLTDVDNSEYKDYIAMMIKSGYMSGNGDGTFSPNEIMTRAEFCKMFNNILGRNESNHYYLKTSDDKTVDHTTYFFTDMEDEVGKWYYNEMLYATSAFDENGYVDLTKRSNNIRNKIDHYNGQKDY